MKKIINFNENFFVENNINLNDIQDITNKLDSLNLDYYDIYFQSIELEIFKYENLKNNIHYVNDYGIGIRIINENKTGFISKNKIDVDNIINEINEINNLINSKNIKNNIIKKEHKKNKYIINNININNKILKSNDKKMYILKYIYKYSMKINNNIKNIISKIEEKKESILIISSDGVFNTEIKIVTRINIFILIEKNGLFEYGNSGISFRKDINFIFKNLHVLNNIIDKAILMSINNLESICPPCGKIPVILKSGWAGVLFHESVGHGLESDFNFNKSSIFHNKLNKKVASDICTIVDDGTIKNGHGFINIDDEGTKSKYNVLIKNGILKSFMYDKFNAKLMNTESTGNGRRESYRHIPIPRMTNTYLLPGNNNPNEIIESIKYGIYAVNFSGGQVDITSGKFSFSACESFIIKNGKILNPLKNVILTGSSIEIMNNISMIGNDFMIDDGNGFCIKNNQILPVGVGQPTIKIDNIIVG